MKDVIAARAPAEGLVARTVFHWWLLGPEGSAFREYVLGDGIAIWEGVEPRMASPAAVEVAIHDALMTTGGGHGRSV